MIRLIGTDIGTAAFSASARTITFSGITPTLDQILAVTNVTRAVVIYNPAVSGFGGTLSGSVLTLAYDTTAMSNSDILQIFIRDASAVPVSAAATDAKLEEIRTKLFQTIGVSALSLPLPAGAATETTLATVAKDGAEITGVSMPTGGSGMRGWLSAIWKALTDRLPASLTSGGNFKTEVQNFPSTQAVSGPLTDTQLRALAVPISATGIPSAIGPLGGLKTELASSFARIAALQPADGEEIRFDIPASLASGSIYIGLNTDATSTATATWKIRRIYFDANKNPSRDRYKSAVAWDDRANALNWP